MNEQRIRHELEKAPVVFLAGAHGIQQVSLTAGMARVHDAQRGAEDDKHRDEADQGEKRLAVDVPRELGYVDIGFDCADETSAAHDRQIGFDINVGNVFIPAFSKAGERFTRGNDVAEIIRTFDQAEISRVGRLRHRAVGTIDFVAEYVAEIFRRVQQLVIGFQRRAAVQEPIEVFDMPADMVRPASGLCSGVAIQGFPRRKAHGEPRARNRKYREDSNRDQKAFLGPVSGDFRRVR